MSLGSFFENGHLKGLALMGIHTNEDRVVYKKLINNKATEKTIHEAFRQGIKGPSHDLKIYTNDWGFNLSEIKSKVYLWYGAKDKNVPLNMGKYYKSQIPNSELFIDPNGGHFSRYNFEEKILKILTD